MPFDNISAYPARQELEALNKLIAAAQEAHAAAQQAVNPPQELQDADR
jgi:hypothetical protein